jgi:hypothetical protein
VGEEVRGRRCGDDGVDEKGLSKGRGACTINTRTHALTSMHSCPLSSHPPCLPQWVMHLEEEFFRQGDREKKNKLTVSPLMDRDKNGVIKSQVRRGSSLGRGDRGGKCVWREGGGRGIVPSDGARGTNRVIESQVQRMDE